MTTAPNTPHLDRLLGALRSRLSRQVLLYGVGSILGFASLWLVFAFLADWGLRVPRPVRIFHGLVFLGVVGYALWRNLLAPMRRLPNREGLALLVERAHPELKEVLVSAVQFSEPKDTRAARALEDGDLGDPQLVQAVLREADERAQELARPESETLPRVLDRGVAQRRIGLGLVAALGVVLFGALRTEHARIFVNRMLGGHAVWPQRTNLVLEIPGLDSIAEVERSPERIRLRVARGTDVPILVEAQGLVPDDVTLHFPGGRDLILSAAGGNVFRTLLRSAQEDVSFYATGGDDKDGLPLVEVEVLQPPDVEGIAVAIRPPAYSGLQDALVFDRDVEVLAGSELVVHINPFPMDATGHVRLLPEDRLIALEPLPFPVDPDQGDVVLDREGLGFKLTPTSSVGYRIELVDATGLTNPDPGLFRIQVIEDRAPEVQVLAPARTDFEIVPGGAVPLRARVEDDYGLVAMDWQVFPDRRDEESAAVAGGSFELLSLAETPHAAAPEQPAKMTAALGRVLVEVDSLGTEELPVAVDQRYVFTIAALDDRAPEANEGRALPLRARVVTPEELLRRLQERLAQARVDAIRLSDLQREKRQRVEELLDAAKSDGALANEELALAAALSGQRRVLGDAGALADELAGVTEDILYARLDEKAGGLLSFFEERMRDTAELTFQSQPWRDLAAAQETGQFGKSGFAANLVQLVGLALEIREDFVEQAVLALDAAEKATAASEREKHLLRAEELQSMTLNRLEDLLEELAEWDNFQNVLTLTRDILNRQKALRERTQQFASEK